MKIFDNKVYLVTGGTGSFGSTMVKDLLRKKSIKEIRIFSRDENKQEKLEIQHTAHSRDLFAEGAINAAKWLTNKKPGLYNMHHVLGIK